MYKVNDIVLGRTSTHPHNKPCALRIDEVINKRGWVGNPKPSYIVSDVSNLFGLNRLLIGEDLIINQRKEATK